MVSLTPGLRGSDLTKGQWFEEVLNSHRIGKIGFALCLYTIETEQKACYITIYIVIKILISG